MVPFVSKMAEAGQTFQYLRYGYCQSVADATRRAVLNKRGIRGLPKTTWQYPFRPYDVRENWGNELEPSEFYRRDFAVPKDEVVADPENCQWTYCARLVRSPYANEGLCFVQTSSIAGAGMGLFMRARGTTIKKGIYTDLKIVREEKHNHFQSHATYKFSLFL